MKNTFNSRIQKNQKIKKYIFEIGGDKPLS
jgi:hypothetical protein